MKFTKIIALSLATVSLLSLTACGKKVCDVCHEVPPTHSVNEGREADLCDYCYQSIILIETDVDVEMIKETDFNSLTNAQKNYIVIFVKEQVGYYNAMWGENINDELMNKVYNEAAQKYSKTAEQVKTLVDAHNNRTAKE